MGPIGSAGHENATQPRAADPSKVREALPCVVKLQNVCAAFADDGLTRAPPGGDYEQLKF